MEDDRDNDLEHEDAGSDAELMSSSRLPWQEDAGEPRGNEAAADMATQVETIILELAIWEILNPNAFEENKGD